MSFETTPAIRVVVAIQRVKEIFLRGIGGPDSMTRGYILALGLIAATIIGAYVGFNNLMHQHQEALNVVNVAGRQRMLSQRTFLLAQWVIRDNCPLPAGQCRATLRKEAELLRRSHNGLVHGNQAMGLPPTTEFSVVQGYITGVPTLDKRVLSYVDALIMLAETPAGAVSTAHPAVELIQWEGPNRLLQDLDRLVLLHQEAGERRMDRLRVWQTFFVVSTLFILLMEAMLIFAPMVRQVRRQMRQMTDISDARLRANEVLELEVARRTQEIEHARQEAEHANRSKSRFLVQAGHDLLQPLEGSIMLTGMLQRQNLTERGGNLVRDLQTTHRSMSSIIHGVLDLSKLEAGVVVPDVQPVRLQDLFEQLFAEFGAVVEAKNVDFRVVSTSALVMSDPLLLTRIIRNLVSNGVRYCNQGKVLLGVRRRPSGIEIQVHDTGQGVPEDQLEIIFEEFVQLKEEDRDRSEGIGLGLAIVQRLSTLLHHPITVTSKPGKGVAFGVYIDEDRELGASK